MTDRINKSLDAGEEKINEFKDIGTKTIQNNRERKIEKNTGR
jgi:hypothetical protein